MAATALKGFKIMGSIQQHPRFLVACKTVADDWRKLGHAIRQDDQYASHVTEAQKEKALADMLAIAERLEKGEIGSFTLWQRVNYELTGECVPFLSRGAA